MRLTAVLLAVGITLANINSFGQGSKASSVPVAGPNRPVSVPEGYVITPAGYFHPSCVQSLSQGERLLQDGRLQHADGTVASTAQVCNYPRYTYAGAPVVAGAANPNATQSSGAESLPEVNGWLENANITTNSPNTSYGALVATWIVPPQPTADDGQTLFLYPGMEDIDDTQSILQPVLQWFNGQWSLASWNCCLNNIVTSSPQVNVSPGDTIYGSIVSNCPAGSVSCSTWTVLSVDLTTGKNTELANTPSDGQVFNWAFGAVLEPYSVISCRDYPRNRQIVFYDITTFDEYLHLVIDPRWSVATNTTETPQCNYGVNRAASEIILKY